MAVGIHSGDWHGGADRYRDWIEGWVPKPDVTPRIREMLGGMREIMIRENSEQPSRRYEDIVTFAQDVRRSPRPGAFNIAGWLYNGHDTYYPEYNPIPELGGAAALTAALDKVRAMDLAAGGYINARLCNHETETYKTFGRKWAVLGKAQELGVAAVDVFELQEDWNKSWDHAKRGEGRFAVMCPSAAGWQEHITGQMEKMVRNYRFDGLFIDQPGSYYAELCYSPLHGHSNPGTAWGPGYVEIFRRARKRTRRANPRSFLWTEGMNDVYGQFLDYTMDKSLAWEPMRSHPQAQSFVEMWRYTLPWYVTGNYPGSYSFPPSKDPVYGDGYFFVNGIRGIDSSLPRGGGGGDEAAHSAYVARIAELWEKGAEFLVNGRFQDNVGLSVSDRAVLAKLYRSSAGYAVAVWNTSASAVKAEVSVDPVKARRSVELAPHAVDLIVFRTSR
jgi:hypothetical protein